ncbi:MAG: ABC transporter substrate-binding protein [Gammaproteobacteria bacterium]|nr:ABC transporter substrate-binding protein [Gammaproteobacteria bacterium]
MNVRALFLLFLLFGFVGCTAIQPGQEISADKTEALFSKGQYDQAAKDFMSLAQAASGNQQTYLQLRAAAALARSEHVAQAKQLLQATPVAPNDTFDQMLLVLTKAHIAMGERLPNDALQLLATPLPTNTPQLYQAEFYKLRADAHTMLGNRLDTARELVEREKHLSDPDLIKSNQEAIWAALASMSERSLQMLRTAPPPDILSGWMELVQLAKVYQLSPIRLKQEILAWQQKYPNHPVSPEILAALTERKPEDVAYPDRVALLLPLSGKFANAGEALRDGFTAAYYTRRPNPNQRIRIYDVGEDPSKVKEVYKKAIQDGAQFVVGPLDKEAVQTLAQMDDLPVPTLALNYLSDEDQTLHANMYQFGLSPEDEARQVAERTWLDGHVNAGVLVPAGPWGERIYAAFQQRWIQLGGHIVEMQTYDATKNDFSQPIKALLNIDDSQARYRRIATILKRDIKFTPRRRMDIDFIFLAAFPRQARQIRPQLKFYQASDVPVYSTSHVFTGVLNQERDRDMDGLEFGDMPWVLAESTAHRGMRADIENEITDAGNALQRIYALGIDAFNIIGALNTLRAYPYERYDGETGSLSLDNRLRVQRQLTWVKFRSGRPVPIDQGNM